MLGALVEERGKISLRLSFILDGRNLKSVCVLAGRNLDRLRIGGEHQDLEVFALVYQSQLIRISEI
jgi:hypothetical protein